MTDSCELGMPAGDLSQLLLSSREWGPKYTSLSTCSEILRFTFTSKESANSKGAE
jgi:hypothetical protein